MRRLESLLKVLAAAAARVHKTCLDQLLHRFSIRAEPLALPHLVLPVDAEPAQVLAHCLCEIGPRSLRIKVLIAKPQDAVRRACSLHCNPERSRMTQVQEPRR